MILGLDLSATRTGWASLYPDDGAMSAYGSWRFPKGNPPGKRWWAFLEKLRAAHEAEAFTAIGYEKVMPNVQFGKTKKGPASHVYGALLAVVEMFAAENDIPLFPIHIATAKKTAGHGRFSKEQMIDAAQKRWGVTIINHDEADALWVGETARMQFNAG